MRQSTMNRGQTSPPGSRQRPSETSTVDCARWSRSRLPIAVAIVLFAAFAHREIFAGNWHYSANVECNDCHTEHNSSDNQPMRTDNVATPAPRLLLRATAMELCLSCHDGSKPTAPDVIAPVTYLADAAGGEFPNSGGIPTDIAHHLNNVTPEVPPGGTIPMILTCTTCHDPHGNANYRNLRPDPTGTGIPGVAVLAHETVVANGSNPAVVYAPSNIVYTSGLSSWCGQCHGAPVPGGDHPVDRSIFGSAMASYARWSTGTATTVVNALGISLPRVPSHSPSDNTYPSADDQVMCLSCHKAHGSQNWRTLIHPDGATLDSACEECHDQ